MRAKHFESQSGAAAKESLKWTGLDLEEGMLCVFIYLLLVLL